MHRIITLTIIVLSALALAGQTVKKCLPGKLATMVEDCNITTLEIAGEMDARDFRFIADSLRHLTTLDLSQVTIRAYSNPFKPLFGNTLDYSANVIPDQSLAHLTQLVSLNLPTNATGLGAGSLAGCPSLAELRLPQSLTHIGEYALSGCTALTTVWVSPALTVIEQGAFSNCPMLATVATWTQQGSGRTPEAATASALEIGYRAFANCPSLKTVNLGDKWTSLGGEAFAETGLERLNLKEQTLLDSVPDWAWAHSRLQDLQLPAQVRAMGEGALMQAAGIGRITLPATLRFIGSYAMAGMTGLQYIASEPEHTPQLGDSVWNGVQQSAVTLKVGKNSRTEYANAAQWCNFMITSAMRGDVNDDGSVDIGDVNILINIMLQRDDADNYDGRAYVTEGDYIVDIADINAVINIMLARALAMRLAAEQAMQQEQHTAAPVAPIQEMSPARQTMSNP